jgi:DNA polymerase-3 subunit chi
MPEASFYILSSRSLQERFLFACKLIEKAYRSGQFCYVYTDTLQQCQQLDDQLWTFRKNSFIPHQIYHGADNGTDNKIPDYEQTVLIGTHTAPERWQKLIFNLSSRYPDNLTKTERILEILDENEELKQAGRQRFRQYNKDGFNTTTHNM